MYQINQDSKSNILNAFQNKNNFN